MPFTRPKPPFAAAPASSQDTSAWTGMGMGEPKTLVAKALAAVPWGAAYRGCFGVPQDADQIAVCQCCKLRI